MTGLLYMGDVPIRLDQYGVSVVLWCHQQLFGAGSITSAPEGLGYHPGLGHALWHSLRKLRLEGLPLITFAHDWYPDASRCPRWGL
ncbi:hypothetical protein [Synechococcus sp. RedBA-s]|uniref:hypothetical protein n=1 Tax=Synechococcus sp. RedBA-s TaxID=2823741 RepID=UPI0020CCA95B|nr:hypothetical protein [Synechococcus sp. RedBA-s]MCP9801910.1 hypothetical protein [Synechococcus sp. RedBA-s]